MRWRTGLRALGMLLTACVVLARSVPAAADEDRRVVRTARVVLVGGRWEIDPALSGVAPFDGRALRVRWRGSTARAPEVAVTVAPPGLRAARRPEPHVHRADLRLGPADANGRLPVLGLVRSDAGADTWPHRLGPATESVPLDRVFSPDMRLRAYSRRNPYRNAFTLVRIEREDAGPAREWTLDDWTRAVEADLAALAAAVPADAAARPGFGTRRRQEILESAGVATALPAPGAIASLAALESVFADDPAALHATGTILLARFLAGDAARTEAPGWRDWARTADQTDLVLVMKPGGRFWARAAMLSPNPQVRDEAFRILGETDMTAAVAGDLLDAARHGTIVLPPALRSRVESGPTEDRTVLGAAAAHAGWFALLGALLVAGFALLARQMTAHASRTESAALYATGLALLALGLVTEDADHASDFVGCLLASVGVSGVFRERGVPSTRFASSLFVLAGIVELATRWTGPVPALREASALLVAAAFLLATGAACRIEGRRVGFAFAVTWLAPVVAWHVAEVAALAGHPFPEAPRIVSAQLLVVAAFGTLWSLREVANAAAGLELEARAARGVPPAPPGAPGVAPAA